MIVRCNVGCRNSDGMTDASLDVDRDTIVCNACGDDLNDLSSYTKLSMRANGDIRRDHNKKAFVFPCKTCDKMVQATMSSGLLVGKSCPQGGKGCKINITDSMAKAVELYEGE